MVFVGTHVSIPKVMNIFSSFDKSFDVLKVAVLSLFQWLPLYIFLETLSICFLV